MVCDADVEETEDEDEEDDDEHTGARPRRISELKIPNKVKPIPLASSLFVFSPTNRSVTNRLISADWCKLPELEVCGKPMTKIYTFICVAA